MSAFYPDALDDEAVKKAVRALDEKLMSLKGREPDMHDRLAVFQLMIAVRVAVFGRPWTPGLAMDPTPADIERGFIGCDVIPAAGAAMSDRLIERRDGTGVLHDFYGDDSCSSHMPEKCRACEYDKLKHSVVPALVDALRRIHELIGIVRSDYHEYAAEKEIEQICVFALRSAP